VTRVLRVSERGTHGERENKQAGKERERIHRQAKKHRNMLTQERKKETRIKACIALVHVHHA